jgi:hypothetical protein
VQTVVGNLLVDELQDCGLHVPGIGEPVDELDLEAEVDGEDHPPHRARRRSGLAAALDDAELGLHVALFASLAAKRRIQSDSVRPRRFAWR